jgi:hypothetical protein
LDEKKRIICICGYPFAGKSLVGSILAEKHGWSIIEADDVGKAILESEPKILFGDRSWNESMDDEESPYPYPDYTRIEWECQEVFERVLMGWLDECEGPAVVVGLRSTSVIRSLREYYGSRAHVQVFYVLCGLRNAENRYAEITGRRKCTYRRRRLYAIECDQEDLRSLAVYALRNVASKESLRARLLAHVFSNGRLARAPLVPCVLCGLLREAHKRITAEENPSADVSGQLCKTCYERECNSERCSICGKMKPVHKRKDDGSCMCKNCYRRSENIKRCIHCNRSRSVYHRNRRGEAVCRSCHRLHYRRDGYKGIVPKDMSNVIRCSMCNIELHDAVELYEGEKSGKPLCTTCEDRKGSMGVDYEKLEPLGKRGSTLSSIHQ